MTHTHANLEVSRATYDEIACKLKAAGYDHAFSEDGVIDMHGIGLVERPIYDPNTGTLTTSTYTEGKEPNAPRIPHNPLPFVPMTDAELHEMAESEGDGCISVGGLAVELGLYKKPDECQHPYDKRLSCKIPLPYGSADGLECEVCGAYLDMRPSSVPSYWKKGPLPVREER